MVVFGQVSSLPALGTTRRVKYFSVDFRLGNAYNGITSTGKWRVLVPTRLCHRMPWEEKYESQIKGFNISQ